MSYPLPPWSNAAFRFALVGGALLVAVVIFVLAIYVRSPLFTNQHNPIEQPILFDHRHHVADDQIDCRYCHQTVETSASAGFPSTALCMNCHSQVWNRSPLLDPVRESFFSGKPLTWRRVYRLPDFVYFNHSIHVNKGVGCVTCHGRVDQQAGIAQAVSLTMGFCVDCHRDPEPHLRPRKEVTNMGWKDDTAESKLGRELATTYDVSARTACTTCHR